MNEIYLKVSSTLENDGFMRNTISSFIMNLNPTMNEIIEVKTIVSEAFSNAVIHGYRNDSSKFVDVHCQLLEDGFILEMIDKGRGIKNIQQACMPLYSSLKGEEHSGMGITIMEDLSDDFMIESSNRGTKLTIKKYVKKIHAYAGE